jgi:hypothetical protein
MVQLQRIAPRHRQLLSMKLHIGYPIVTKGHKLTGIAPIAKLTKAHRNPTCSQTKNYADKLRTCCIPQTKPTRPSYPTRSKLSCPN